MKSSVAVAWFVFRKSVEVHTCSSKSIVLHTFYRPRHVAGLVKAEIFNHSQAQCQSGPS